MKTPNTDLHRCNVCGLKHRYPKAHRAASNIAQAVVLAVLQVLAALALDGWLAVALWVMVGRNALAIALTTYGLAQLAVENGERQR